MAKWKYRVEFKEDFAAAEDDRISIQELCKRIVPKLKALPIYAIQSGKHSNAVELHRIVEEFEGMSEDSEADSETFDAVLDRLFDWGDRETLPGQWPSHRLCWIGALL